MAERELKLWTGAGGARLAEYHLFKYISPDLTEDELQRMLDQREYPNGIYEISSGIDEPYIKYLGNPYEKEEEGGTDKIPN